MELCEEKHLDKCENSSTTTNRFLKASWRRIIGGSDQMIWLWRAPKVQNKVQQTTKEQKNAQGKSAAVRGVGNSKNTKNGCAFLPLLLCHFWRFSPFFAFFIFRNLASPFPLFLTTSIAFFPFCHCFLTFFPFLYFSCWTVPFFPKNDKNDEDKAGLPNSFISLLNLKKC
jgi:hypothetical protein